MESPHKCSSFKNLVGTIESLLGSKSDFTVTWAQSVKLIAEDLSNASCPSTPCTPSLPDISHENDKLGLEGELVLLKAAYAFSNVHRKIALNKLLDLKGNIRVFCRVRPLPTEHQPLPRGVVASGASNEVQVSACGRTRSYKFDKVFLPTSLQDDVFSEVEPIVRSAMDGNNVCIFAYGQTGTGKTFTMEGSHECPGVVPRTLQQLFFDASLDATAEYSFKLSMLEVYRGSLRDLLVPRQEMNDQKSLCIQMGGQGCMEIENLTELPIHSASHAAYYYRKGMRARSTSWTTANETSSRSHCLVRITISCRCANSGQKADSKLWLVDLGGSERFFKTQAQGQTLEEGKAINSSLSALGDVISALQRKQAHIPYRNSKLTQILRDCLGGKNSKALMLVHVSPKEEDVGETLCSLGFASRARGIHLGKELSPSARDEQMAVMDEVLKKSKMYESECQKLNDNIRMIESLLRSKTGTQLDGGNDELPLATTTVRAGNKSLSSDKSVVTVVPRFMTPTLSSESKKRVNAATATATAAAAPTATAAAESVVSVTMETTMEKLVVKGSETKQVRRTLNFQVVSGSREKAAAVAAAAAAAATTTTTTTIDSGVKLEVATRENVTRKLLRPRDKPRCAWDELGSSKKNGKARRRWTLECSSRISITKRF